MSTTEMDGGELYTPSDRESRLQASSLGGFDPIRPDIAFIVTWAAVIAIYIPIPTPLTPPFDTRVLGMILGNMATGVLVYLCAKSWVAYRHAEIPARAFRLWPEDGRYVDNFIGALFVIWALVYLANIVYSGGLGAVWVAQGKDAGHNEWGIPTLGGLNFMMRCFIGTLLIWRFAEVRRPIYLIVWAFLAFCYLLEINRGGLFIFMCHSIAIAFLVFRVSLKNLVTAVVVVGLLAVSYTALGSLRGIQTRSSDYGDTAAATFGAAPAGLIDLWLYAATPIGNVNYAVKFEMRHNYYGYNTLLPVFPTVIRGFITGDTNEYPVKLASDAYNATSIYGPLLSDFDFWGAFAIVALLQYVAAYIYVMGKRGFTLYKLVYPAIFASIILSMFYIYAASLVILMYPLLCLWLKHYVRRRREHDIAPAQQPA